ncbi:MAG: hypothetical protein HOO06_05785 [Bdellovibrionaceae bacterium]|jgi:tetratricopeptide (TPR) repeat protein|nr:hypothetical protein [Pseudobdellovibrionaceae bacterium]
MIKIVTAAMLLLSLLACTSASLTVNSVPEKARVLIRPVGGGELIEMGLTPTVVSNEKLKSAGADSGPIIVEVHKDDFLTESILITESSATDMKLDFALQLVDDQQGQGPGKGLESSQSLNQAIDRLFEVRKFIALESYNEALNRLNFIEQKWPYLSAVYELRAGIFFLQKKYKDALAAYSLAQKYNPNSVPIAQMQKTLEDQLGIDGRALAKKYERGRLPASKLISKKKKKKKKSKKQRSKKRRKSKRKRKK